MNGKKLQVILGVVAVGCLVFGFVIQGAPPDQRAGAINKWVETHKQAGAKNTAPGIPQELPLLPPSTVDYRNNDMPLIEIVDVDGDLITIGSRFEAPFGTVATGGACTANVFCADCEACTEDICCTQTDVDDGKCTVGEIGTCVNPPRGAGSAPVGCDDGLFCNGQESCDGAGVCDPGTPRCQAEGEECDEVDNLCRAPCINDDQCDDGLLCTGDFCDNPGPNGICKQENPCGPGSGCSEPEPPDVDPICGVGRCCTAPGEAGCSEKTFADCQGAGEAWLAEITFEPACVEVDPSGNTNDCPDYASGISPQGTFTGEIGPISGLSCDSPDTSVGDDYKIGDGSGFYNVEFLRFAGSVLPGTPSAPARWDIEFYTIGTDTTDPIFIEDVFWPDGRNDGVFEAGIRTVDFDPPLTIPKTGIVVWRVQENFGPAARVTMLATDAVDVGDNDLNKMWLNGTFGEVGLPPNQRILAFELVGETGDDPTGACCISDTGDCERELPWICEAQGNVFQGPGTFCNFCANDPFKTCSKPNDCGACSLNPLVPCEIDADCDDDKAGTCTETAACILLPPACRSNACCNPDGSCVGLNVCSGGFAALDPAIEPGAGAFCDLDEECPGLCSNTNPFLPDLCEADSECFRCVGGVFDGALCENLGVCPGGSCDDGDNNPQTPRTCDGGERNELECDDCPGGECDTTPICDIGTCPTVCPDGFAAQGFGTSCGPNCCAQPEPTGGDTCSLIINSPYLHTFNVPALGTPPISVTISDTNSLATFIGFPLDDCGAFADVEGTGAPWWIGFSIDDCANVRLDLCCTDISGEPLRPAWGNLWKDCPCTGLLGNSGVEPPIGIGRDTRGFARGGPFCDDDNLWQTFRTLRAGQYFYPIFANPTGTSAVPPGADFQFHITVGACPQAACCIGETCQITSELECEDLNGYWLAFETTPDEVGNVVSCGTEESNPCRIGSCCLGPGDCEDRRTDADDCDRSIPVTCINKEGCDSLEGGGDYVGGGSCDYPTPPCPACDLGGSNCQSPGLTRNSWVIMSDLSVSPAGNLVADDFVPTGATINRVCTWGAYIDGTICTGDQNCNCVDEVTDQFRITVYNDAGGYPGTVFGSSTVTETPETPIVRAPVASALGLSVSGIQMFEYQLKLDTPIEGLDTTGETVYWLEIANNTEESRTCLWNWSHTSLDFNDYSAVGGASGYLPGGTHPGDMAFCLDVNLEAPPTIEAACCVGPSFITPCVDQTCSGPVEVGACAGEWDVTQPDCPSVTAAFTCPSSSVPGDTCETDAIPITGSVQLTTDTICANTDGPLGADNMGKDVWFAYTVPCTGKVTVSMCGADNLDTTYDSMMLVYKDPTNPTICPCPDDPGFTLVVDSTLGDEGCTGFFDGGSGIGRPPPSLPGDCLMIRVGGFGEAGGRGHLTVGCELSACFPSAKPEEELLAGFGGLPSPNRKNRYISVRPGNTGRTQSIRIRFKSLPLPFDIWNHNPAGGPAPNGDYFVGKPFQRCENGGQVLFSCTEGICSNPPNAPCSIDVDCCGAAGPLPQNWFWAAPLECDVTDAALREWRGKCIDGTCNAGLNKDEACANDEDCSPVVHVSHEGIVPGGVYDVQVIDSECNLGLEASYSDPLEITQAVWGDLCSNGPGGACTGVADGSPEVIQDVLGLIDKFQNINALQKPMADLVPGDDGTNNGPDFKVTIIGDALFALDAFQGFDYPFDPGDPCAADSGLSSQGVALSAEEARPVHEGSR